MATYQGKGTNYQDKRVQLAIRTKGQTVRVKGPSVYQGKMDQLLGQRDKLIIRAKGTNSPSGKETKLAIGARGATDYQGKGIS